MSKSKNASYKTDYATSDLIALATRANTFNAELIAFHCHESMERIRNG